MAIIAKPEILAPRSRKVGSAFSDENLDLLSHVLDDFIQIPGTSIRFGLDGIIGLIPGVGDLLGGLASCILIVAAYFRGVPRVTVARMMLNVATETVIGSLPIVGDMFDVWFRANRRNYALMTGELTGTRERTWTDWLILGAAALFLLGIMLLPLLLFGWAATHIETFLRTR